MELFIFFDSLDFLFRLFVHHNTSSYVGWVGRLHTYSYSSDFFIVFFTKISGGKYGKISNLINFQLICQSRKNVLYWKINGDRKSWSWWKATRHNFTQPLSSNCLFLHLGNGDRKSYPQERPITLHRQWAGKHRWRIEKWPIKMVSLGPIRKLRLWGFFPCNSHYRGLGKDGYDALIDRLTSSSGHLHRPIFC